MFKVGLPVVAVFAASLSASTVAMAAPVLFTESAIASGSLGSLDFSQSLVTLTAYDDTDNFLNHGGDFYSLADALVQVTITNLNSGVLGAGNFTDQLGIVSHQATDEIGIGDRTTDQAILYAHVPHDTHDLLATFGPVFGESSYDRDDDFATTAGELRLTSVGLVTEVETVSAAPEPASWALMIMGLGGLGLTLRRAKRTLPASAATRPESL